MSAKVFAVELTEPIHPVGGMAGFDHLAVLVRHRGRPLGWVWLANGNRDAMITGERILAAIDKDAHWALGQRLVADYLNPGVTEARTPISVVICSSGATGQLERSLEALFDGSKSEPDVVVVDNSDRWNWVEAIVTRFPARLVREDRPGIDAARNRGIAEARHDVIAFTHDRATVDHRWLPELRRVFTAADAEVVAGGVFPAEFETESQHHAENEFGRGLGVDRAVWHRWRLDPARLLWARDLGSGANLAVRRSVFERLGGFDSSLSGAPGWDGFGDADFLVRSLRAEVPVHFEPSALVWLTHPRHPGSLALILRGTARAQTVFWIRSWAEGAASLASTLQFCLARWSYGRLTKRLFRTREFPLRLTLAEWSGSLRGAVAWLFRRADAQRALPRVACPVAGDPSNDRRAGPVPASERSKGVESSNGSSLVPPVARSAPAGGAALGVRVIRTHYGHWGRYSGMNQFLRFLDRERVRVEEQLVDETDREFAIRSHAIRGWLRHRIQRNGMPWYGLADLSGELASLGFYLDSGVARVVHYLDGEHSGQFLPRWRSRGPRRMATYHQPPDVLATVTRPDVISRMDLVTAVSPDQVEYLSAIVAPDRVRLTPHGIDTDFFRPSSRGADNGRLRCLTVGHNYRDYGAVRAVAKLLAHRPEIEFVTVSPRSTGLEGLPNARCLSRLSDEDLLATYQTSDVLFIPLTKVTANNAVLEGLAAGLPVVSTALPAMSLYLDSSSAVLLSENSPATLAEILLELTKDRVRLRSMGLAARERALTFDWRRIAHQFQRIYEELEPTRR